jgi:hypothetical protein
MDTLEFAKKFSPFKVQPYQERMLKAIADGDVAMFDNILGMRGKSNMKQFYMRHAPVGSIIASRDGWVKRQPDGSWELYDRPKQKVQIIVDDPLND